MYKDAMELNNLYLYVRNTKRCKDICVAYPMSKRARRYFNLDVRGIGCVVAGYIEELEDEIQKLKNQS